MNLKSAVVGVGMGVRGEAVGTMVRWKPAVAAGAGELALGDAAGGYERLVTFSAIGQCVEYNTAVGFTINNYPVATSLAVSGISGTDAGVLNGTYVLQATLKNGWPWWKLGNAEVRSMGRYWEIALSDAVRLSSYMDTILPYVSFAAWVSRSANATLSGALTIGPSVTGTSAVLDNRSGKDPEGAGIAANTPLLVEVECLSGEVAIFGEEGGRHMGLLAEGGVARALSPGNQPTAGFDPSWTILALTADARCVLRGVASLIV